MTPAARAASRLRCPDVEQAEDLAGLSVPADPGLLEDRLSIACHLEAPAARGLQRHGDVGEPISNRGRQTGGPGLVVSNRAVLDVDRRHDLVVVACGALTLA